MNERATVLSNFFGCVLGVACAPTAGRTSAPIPIAPAPMTSSSAAPTSEVEPELEAEADDAPPPAIQSAARRFQEAIDEDPKTLDGELGDALCAAGVGAACYRRAMSAWTTAVDSKRGAGEVRQSFSQSCERGFDPACAVLGYLLSSGVDGPPDPAKAMGLWSHATQLVLPELSACEEVGARIMRGPRSGGSSCDRALISHETDPAVIAKNVVRIRTIAIAPLEDACSRKVPLACHVFARTLLFGVTLQDAPDVVVGDHDRAMKLEQSACDGGVAAACFEVGDYEMMFTENKARKRAALAPIRRACDGGDGRACLVLGETLDPKIGGEGYVLKVGKDPRGALALYERSCALGMPRVCADLAAMYREGGDLTPKDETRADQREAREKELSALIR